MGGVKKLVPCILFNTSDYVYPKGLRVTDMADREAKLASGWNTGPVDNGGRIEAVKPKYGKKKCLSHLNVTELISRASRIPMEVDEDMTRNELIKAIREAELSKKGME